MCVARLPNFDRAINQIVFGLLHQKPKLKNQSEIEFRAFDLKLGGFRWCWIRMDLGLRLLLLRGERILTKFIAIFLYVMGVVLRRFKRRGVIQTAIESFL
jgi:hypothetical protein